MTIEELIREGETVKTECRVISSDLAGSWIAGDKYSEWASKALTFLEDNYSFYSNTALFRNIVGKSSSMIHLLKFEQLLGIIKGFKNIKPKNQNKNDKTKAKKSFWDTWMVPIIIVVVGGIILLLIDEITDIFGVFDKIKELLRISN